MNPASTRAQIPTEAPAAIAPRQATQPIAKLWYAAMWVFAVVTIAIYGIYAVSAFNLRAQPFTGALYTYTMVVNAAQPTGDAAWPALDAGLRRQDRILEVGGQALPIQNDDYAATRARFEELLSGYAIGDTVTLTVERLARFAPLDPELCDIDEGADSAICTVSFTLTAFPNGDFLAYFLLPFLAGCVIIGIGITLLIVRGARIHVLFASMIAFLTAIYAGGLFDVGTTHQLTPLWLMAAVWTGGALATFGLTFPNQPGLLYRQSWLQIVPMVISSVVGLVVLYQYLYPATPWDHNATQTATTFMILGLLACIVFLLLFQRPRAVTAVTRDQVNSVLIGTSLMIVLALLWMINRAILMGGQNNLIAFETLMVLFLFPNAAIAYAVMQYRRMDTDRILSRGITYGVLLLALITGIYLLVFGTTLIAQRFIDTSDPFVVGLLLFGMVLFFAPLRNALQKRIDAIYYRTRRNYQQSIESFSQQITTLNSYPEIVKAYRDLLDEIVQPTAHFVYEQSGPDQDYVAYTSGSSDADTQIRFSPDSALIKLLSETDQPIILYPDRPWPHQLWPERGRLSILRAAVLVPMRGSSRLNGFVVLGPPRANRRYYNFEEIRFLINLTAQFSIATERAQVVSSLERRVRELDVLSQVSQAVSFTIDFDDLLELIYTQTSKLLQAPCFYIALADETRRELYFAFFLEDDDRIESNENLRWGFGSDPYSRVTRTAKPLRLENYRAEVEAQGLRNRPETSRMRAWMGVPLTAKSTTLGVMAVGKTGNDAPYTDEQFKILVDIAALAATSIERARLFTETKLRERQLTVLNDIARQLVASESDVENLLKLITDSAVDILEAEAGALLLTVDDSSRDLEFRVVIGGAGDELLGTRIAAGKGIVGEVALNGEATIVNDVADDPRHARDFDSEGTRARSLLTVPLIAKDSVIGVLQVMNKRDGSIFVDADATLLNTFAGQAAVAIENARLLQMQDIQLADRVRELEILENIDRDLNRTLDLREVARITVQSAMSVLEAQAGALGLVNHNPPYLEIVAIEGYGEDEYPQGAEGLIWPLDKGIVGRVMRTKSADLAADVSIDPDYRGGLTDSLSQITVPMLSGDEINAVLMLEKSRRPAFNLNDWAFAQRLAEHASIAIANAQLYTALTEANRSKSTFMGFAAHELKNPLTPIKGYADGLLMGMAGELSDQQKSLLKIVRNNVSQLETIIADLRDAARIDANEFRVDVAPMDIRHAVIGALQPFVHILDEKRQELINNVPEGLPLVLGDETRLIQVLTNLVSNAHKYSPEDTTITISAEVVRNYVDSRGKKRSDMLRVSVTDEGIGMSKEDVARLFHEKYFRSSNQQALKEAGTGLGMMLSYGIVQQHGGVIEVDSVLGEGSTFHVYIPLAPQPSDAARSQPQDTRLSAEPGSD